jgi:flagellar hook-length control protein FliK
MNIDVNALLSRDAGQLPAQVNLITPDFNVALDDKLQVLDLVIPVIGESDVPVMPHASEAVELPVLTGDALTTDLAAALAGTVHEEGDEGEERQAEETDPLTFIETLVLDNPQWQLQQLVNHNVATAANSVTNVSLPKDVTPRKETFYGVTKATEPEVIPLANVVSLASVITSKTQPPTQSETPPVELVSAQLLTAPPSATRLNLAPSISTVASIAYAPNSLEWKQAISQQIAIFSRNGVHNAEIRLHPEKLGSLQISMRLHQEQAQIHIVSEHPLVRQTLEQAMPQLRAAMAESGLHLSQASVGADSPYSEGGAHGDTMEDRHKAQPQSDENSAEKETLPLPDRTVTGNINGINIFA